MSPSQSETIQTLLDRAKAVREEALDPSNKESLGYPYYTGYVTSLLDEIQQVLTKKD